ncbi:MAG: PH domain-containing protein, partial [Rhodospirillaceae bacterium]|nr:PH domain-containing protein [Rhodospirillaceae bacterium]
LLPLSLQPVIGGGCILFAAYQVAFCLMKLFTNRPGLIVDDTGLTIGANILPARFVCWDEIARISTKRLMGSSILEITLHDRDAVLKRAGPLSVFVDRIRIGANTTSINVPPVAVDTDIDALAERLKAFHKSKTPKPASPPAPKTI